MNLSVLKYFIEIAECRSFTRASERLFITQPTLSRQIQDLEEEMGVQLLIRGGRIIGVAPRFFDVPGVLTELCDELILTGTMDERKAIMESRADAFIIAPGGIGTLDEFFEVLTLLSLGQHQKPVALYNVAGYYDELMGFLRKMEREAFIAPSLWDSLGVFDDPDALLDYMMKR